MQTTWSGTTAHRLRVILALAFMLLASLSIGCDQLLNTESPKKVEAAPPKPEPHHFAQVPQTQGSLAVDDKTGQMCRTWDWAPTGEAYVFQGNTIVSNKHCVHYGIQCSAIAQLPLCSDVAKH